MNFHKKRLSSNHKTLFVSSFFDWRAIHFLFIDLFCCSFCKRTTFTAREWRVADRSEKRVPTKHTIYIAIFIHFTNTLLLYICTSHSCSFTIPSLIQFSHKHIFIRLIFLSFFFFSFFISLPLHVCVCLIFALLFVCLFVVTCYRVSVQIFGCQQYSWFVRKKKIKLFLYKHIHEQRTKTKNPSTNTHTQTNKQTLAGIYTHAHAFTIFLYIYFSMTVQ